MQRFPLTVRKSRKNLNPDSFTASQSAIPVFQKEARLRLNVLNMSMTESRSVFTAIWKYVSRKKSMPLPSRLPWINNTEVRFRE